MAKIGTFVTDPKAGGYCRITLDSGQKIIVNHAQGGFKGGPVTIEEVKWMGLGAGEMLFTCDLDSPHGKGILARLTRDATPGTADATPLGAFVNYVKDCRTIADLKTKCSALI
ncbi:MAG: hypothetical protein WEG40_18395 [Candidatus Rokuibacteriota bacterium]